MATTTASTDMESQSLTSLSTDKSLVKPTTSVASSIPSKSQMQLFSSSSSSWMRLSCFWTAALLVLGGVASVVRVTPRPAAASSSCWWWCDDANDKPSHKLSDAGVSVVHNNNDESDVGQQQEQQQIDLASCMAPPDPNDCTAVPPLLELCPQQLTSMTLRYTGAFCDDRTDTLYNDCVDYNNQATLPSSSWSNEEAYIVVTDLDNERIVYFSGWVRIGDEFVLDKTSYGSHSHQQEQQPMGLGLYHKISVYKSTVDEATGAAEEQDLELVQVSRYQSWICSGRVAIGNQYGSCQVMAMDVHTQTFQAFPPSNGKFEFDLVVTAQEEDDHEDDDLLIGSMAVQLEKQFYNVDIPRGTMAPHAVDDVLVVPFWQGTIDLRDEATGPATTHPYQFQSLVTYESPNDPSDICIDVEDSEVFIGASPYSQQQEQQASSGDCHHKARVQCRVTQLCGMFDWGLPPLKDD